MKSRFVVPRTFTLADPRRPVRLHPQPDAVQRGLTGEIISRFEKRGYKVCSLTFNGNGEQNPDRTFSLFFFFFLFGPFSLFLSAASSYQLVALKMLSPGQEHLEKHYADLKDKKFFPGLIKYMNSGPVVAMVWEGRDAVK
jgi:nucleoside-diphosphate kinase